MPKAVPARNATIPKNATYDRKSQTWQLGSKAEHLQIWHPCGWEILDATFADGKLHGAVRLNVIGAHGEYGTDHYAYCNGLIEELGLPDGDRATQIRAELVRGELRKVKFVIAMGEDILSTPVSAKLRGGRLETLRWEVSADCETVFSHAGIEITRKDMKVPKPWPAKIELGFVNGKIATRTYLDRRGKPLVVPPPAPKVTEWGQATKKVDGYIASGRFAKDVATFFPGAEPGKLDRDAKRAPKVFANLAEPHRAAATAFDALVKAGFPELERASLSGYGFDCKKNELYGAEDSKYFGLSYTSGSDLQLLDVETGTVLEWVHDEEPFQDDAVFPSLDAYAFAILRMELAGQKRIPKKEVADVFKRLGFGWARKLI